MGYHCISAEQWTKEKLFSDHTDAVGIVIRSRLTIDTEFLDHFNSLKFIARSGAGMENINTQYASEKGIHCFNSPEGNRLAVGEHALGMLLSLFNNLHTADVEVKKGIWQREANRGIELAGKTVGIIGYGNMGSAFAGVLSGMNCKVLVFDKYKQGFGNEWIEEVSLNTLFTETDILSIHTPLTAETNNMVCSDFINQFDKNIFLINTARGPIVNTSDLIESLKQGKVQGACLDVFDWEEASFTEVNNKDYESLRKELAAMENVILSPHVAGWTTESYEKLSIYLADKIKNTFH